MIKFNWSLPWPTHKYLIEEITEEKYLKTKLFSRFLTFIDSSRKFQQKGALLHLWTEPVVMKVQLPHTEVSVGEGAVEGRQETCNMLQLLSKGLR